MPRIRGSIKAAHQQANEIAALERKITILLQRQLLRIEELAIKYQSSFNLKPRELSAFHKELVECLVAAHILGIDRVQKDTLQLSIVDDVLRKVKGVGELQISSLRAKYDAATVSVVANLTTEVNEAVREAVFAGISDQLATKSIVANIRKSLSNSGLTPANRYRLETTVRTQTALAYNAARVQEYQKPEFAEIIWGYEYIAVGDDRVRPTHAAMDGVKLPKDHIFWKTSFPPNGYNCRCQAVPIFDEVKEKAPPAGAVPDAGFNFDPAALVGSIV